MSGANLLFLVLGAIALLIGGTMLVTAIRGRPAEVPRHMAMLIAGMMAAAFGLLMIAFAIGSAGAPNYGTAQ